MVSIQVTDVNDQIPIFEDPPTSSTNVLMNERTGRSDETIQVIQIVVVDLDLVT